MFDFLIYKFSQKHKTKYSAFFTFKPYKVIKSFFLLNLRDRVGDAWGVILLINFIRGHWVFILEKLIFKICFSAIGCNLRPWLQNHKSRCSATIEATMVATMSLLGLARLQIPNRSSYLWWSLVRLGKQLPA